MDLRKYNPTQAHIDELKSCVGYQPWIITDDFQTGIGDQWINKSGVTRMERNEASEADWSRFTETNAQMRTMYSDWLELIGEQVGDISKMKLIDTACNSCFFPFRFMEMGGGSAVGYDISPSGGRCVDVMRELTDWDVRFVQEPYNQQTHRIDDCEEADIVISSAFMCHISDPMYYLDFLSKITRKALFLFSTFEDTPGRTIRYNEPGKFYELPFPTCYDNMTTVSTLLIREGMKLAGFRDIVEIKYRKGWLPESWYQNWRGYIAIK